jgi:hypothetical protein
LYNEGSTTGDFMSKYTPGPWKIGAHESGKMAVDGANGEEVTGFIDPADAILIAAATDLLKAAQDVLSHKRGEDDWLILSIHCRALEDAVKKATGEQR